MGEEIAVENGRISDFQGLVTLTLDRVILHTLMHQSSTSTHISNFIEIEETLWTDGRTFETYFIRSTRRSRPNNSLVGGWVWTVVWTLATKRAMLYCTWRPCAHISRSCI